MAYQLHSDHGCLPVERQVMRYVSIDPGQDNFVIRIEKRVKSVVSSKCSQVRTLEQDKHIISFKNKKSSWLVQLHIVLGSYSKYYPDVDIALIERQLADNTKMKCMEAALASYFIIKWPNMVVVDLSPKLKTDIFAVEKMTYNQKKKWSPDIANKLTKKRGDTLYNERIATRDKIDDDADSLVQIEAFCIHVGYAGTI